MELLFQFLVLVFTVLVWWLARRDISRRAAEANSPAMADWERLRATVEELIADLERRASAAEQRITDAELRLAHSDGPVVSVMSSPEAAKVRATGGGLMDANQAAHEALYAPVYALLDNGLTDADEIARRTGLTQGEIELILSLRARQARL